MTTKPQKSTKFPESDAGVPLGHYGDGSPLPPFPADPPPFAVPVDEALADHDFLVNQSGTKARLEGDEVAPSSRLAPDGPDRDDKAGDKAGGRK